MQAKSTVARKPVTLPALDQASPVQASAPKAKRTRADNWAKSVPAGTITVLVTSNPKRANKKSAPRFDLYRTGMSVAEHTEAYAKAGFAKSLANADRRWDMAHGFIRIDQ